MIEILNSKKNVDDIFTENLNEKRCIFVTRNIEEVSKSKEMVTKKGSVLEEKVTCGLIFGYLKGVKQKGWKLDLLRNYMKVLTSEKIHRGNATAKHFI